MKAKLLATIALLIFLLLPTGTRGLTSSSLDRFPPYNQTKAYVNDLVTDYNQILQYNWENRPNFTSEARFYTLYTPFDQNFNVLVMLVGPNDNNSLNMLFIPVPGNETTVVYDPYDYLNDITTPVAIPSVGATTTYPGNCGQINNSGVTLCATISVIASVSQRVNLTRDYSTADDWLFNYNGSITFASIAIGVNASDITSTNSSTNAEVYANHLYQSDTNYAQSWLRANTPTSTTTQTTVQNYGDLGPLYQVANWLQNNPILVIGAAILTAVGLIQLVYGSLKKKRDKGDLKPISKS